MFTSIFEEILTFFEFESRRPIEDRPDQPFPFGELDKGFDFLRETLNWAIRMDDKEANSFWRKLRSFLSGSLAAFKRQARKMKLDARQQLEEAEFLYHARIEPHRTAVDRLRNDASGWQRRFNEVLTLRSEAASLERVNGWSGPASEEYASAVRLQVGALDDLSKVMTSAAVSCLKGASENAQRFTNVRLVVTDTVANIRRARGGGGRYYQRTAAAIRGIMLMNDNVDEICFGAGARSFAANLASENRTSASQGIVLTADWWPSGTQSSYGYSHGKGRG